MYDWNQCQLIREAEKRIEKWKKKIVSDNFAIRSFVLFDLEVSIKRRPKAQQKKKNACDINIEKIRPMHTLSITRMNMMAKQPIETNYELSFFFFLMFL